MAERSEVTGAEPLEALVEALGRKKPQIQEAVQTWAVSTHPRYPWREAGKAPYEVFIGEVWLSQATPASAVHVYDRLVQRFHSLRDLAKATDADLTDVLSELRFPEHEQHFKAMAETAWKEGRGEMPRGSEVLFQSLGLERHSIRAVMCFGYGLPVAVIDSNVARMLSRIFARSLPSRLEQGLLEALGQSLLAENDPQQYNCGLLDLAEFVCQQARPLCAQCPVVEVCDYTEM